MRGGFVSYKLRVAVAVREARVAETQSGPAASGGRLLAAFRDLDVLPAAAHGRDRALTQIDREPYSPGMVAGPIESDPALTAAVLGAANRRRDGAASIGTVRAAVELLGRDGVRSVIEAISVFDFFDCTSEMAAYAEAYRLHAIATQRAADHLCGVLDNSGCDELHVAALLHDVGRICLLAAYDGYSELLKIPGTPEQRLALERRHIGIDHALAGGVLLRRLGFPDSLARLVERHHADEAEEGAMHIRLADMMAHYLTGRSVDRSALQEVADRLGIEPAALSLVLHALPHLDARPRHHDPNPLSPRQRDMVRLLAEGKTYKQIGAQVGLSASTVRTHVHQAYRKLNVVDRAQAVLLAKERGWI
ncbi:MAG: HDOD domain-containing protein [Actinobacteria bacterium]|nr:MAG: HDOD domain-containing protein [Actinomycetota bacterium]